jgi:hypothetical protein
VNVSSKKLTNNGRLYSGWEKIGNVMPVNGFALKGTELLAVGRRPREVYDRVRERHPHALIVKVESEELPFGGGETCEVSISIPGTTIAGRHQAERCFLGLLGL